MKAAAERDYAEYSLQLGKRQIQRAYRGILTFMSDFRAHMEACYPEYSVGSVYQGMMDMSYFAFTHPSLKRKGLKVAVVFLHEPFRFEAWLAGSNRAKKAEYLDLLRERDIQPYRLSRIAPGVDSIMEHVLVERPDFTEPKILSAALERGALQFAEMAVRMLEQHTEK